MLFEKCPPLSQNELLMLKDVTIFGNGIFYNVIEYTKLVLGLNIFVLQSFFYTVEFFKLLRWDWSEVFVVQNGIIHFILFPYYHFREYAINSSDIEFIQLLNFWCCCVNIRCFWSHYRKYFVRLKLIAILNLLAL